MARVLQNPLLQTSLHKLKLASRDMRGKDIAVLPFRSFKLFDTVGNCAAYDARYFARRKTLLVSALSSWLWNAAEDISTLEDCIWALCDDYTWALPQHMHGDSLSCESRVTALDGYEFLHNPTESALNLDLFACETGLALAEICALLGDRLHPYVIKRARSEVMRRVINNYAQSIAIQRWEIMENNWCAVCAGSVGSAAMLLVEHDLELTGIIKKLLPTMDRFLASFTEGACTEGLAYWTYGLSFFVIFSEFLKRRTAGELDMLSDDRMASIATFQQHCYFGGGATLTFSDVEANAKYRPGLTSFLAEYFQGVTAPPVESAMDVLESHCFNFGPALFDLIWTNNTLVGKQASPISCIKYEKAQWLLCNGRDETGFAAKGGHNGESHNHNDIGTFTFSKHGAMLLCDIGSGQYTKSYFEDGRYDIFCNSSQSHNVPIVNGHYQGAGREYRARNVTIAEDGAISMDIAGAYPSCGLSSLVRRVVFDHGTGTATLTDDITVDRPISIIERFISFVRPRTEDGVIVLEQGSVKCTLSTDSIPTPEIGRISHINHTGQEVDVYTVDFILSVKDKICFRAAIV